MDYKNENIFLFLFSKVSVISRSLSSALDLLHFDVLNSPSYFFYFRDALILLIICNMVMIIWFHFFVICIFHCFRYNFNFTKKYSLFIWIIMFIIHFSYKGRIGWIYLFLIFCLIFKKLNWWPLLSSLPLTKNYLYASWQDNIPSIWFLLSKVSATNIYECSSVYPQSLSYKIALYHFSIFFERQYFLLIDHNYYYLFIFSWFIHFYI